MKTALMSAVGAFALAGVAFSGAANAQCWWTGYGTACAAPPAPAPAYTTAYTYPTYQATPYYYTPNYYYNGWGASSYPGPRASGH
jgi:hypothetical protein